MKEKGYKAIGFHTLDKRIDTGEWLSLIGIELASRGKKVLLADADFESPTLAITLKCTPDFFMKKKHEEAKEASLGDLVYFNTSRSKGPYQCPITFGDGTTESKVSAQRKFFDSLRNLKVLPLHELIKDAGWIKRVERSLPEEKKIINPFKNGNQREGELYLLPCNPYGYSLKIDYNPVNKRDTSIWESLEYIWDKVNRDKDLDYVLCDLRPGRTDASANCFKGLHELVHVSMGDHKGSKTRVVGYDWYNMLNNPRYTSFVPPIKLLTIRSEHVIKSDFPLIEYQRQKETAGIIVDNLSTK